VKYSIVTFGCRVNQADSLGFEAQLLAAGAEPVPAECADVVIVNTCSVTASADQGARQTIRRLSRLNPSVRVVVTGCYATRETSEVQALPNVLAVVRNDDKARLVDVLRTPASLGPPPSGVGHLADGPCGRPLEPGAAGRTAFTLRVQTGCGESCSYCIIPATRGLPRSLPLSAVLAALRRAIDAGFREVVLTGVHLGSYGRDLAPQSSLHDLLLALRELAARRQDRVLFRISSLEPMDCTEAIVELVAGSECFAPHFHLPLQHASTRMLQTMRRPYDISYYAGLVSRVRSLMPHASIGSDVIAGFPGETDEDADTLASYLQQSPLTHLHVFPYSDRPGTEASRMGDRPGGSAVKARGARLRDIGRMLTSRFIETQRGTVHRALTIDDGSVAVTGNYLKVRIPPGLPRNRWVDVRIATTAPSIVGDVIA